MTQAIVTFAECSISIQLKAKKLQLSNGTVFQRVKCIVNDRLERLLRQSKIFVYFSIADDTLQDFTNTE